MRGLIYDMIGLGFMLASGWFFYRCVEFLAQKDYVAGLVAMVAGFVMVRAGTEISKIGLFIGRDRS